MAGCTLSAASKDPQCVYHHSCSSNTKSSGATRQHPVSLGTNHWLPLVLRVLIPDLHISALVVGPASPRPDHRKLYPNLYLHLTFPREACFHPDLTEQPECNNFGTHSLSSSCTSSIEQTPYELFSCYLFIYFFEREFRSCYPG